MNRSALTWVEIIWNYNANVIDYWTIFFIKINKLINKKFIQIQRCMINTKSLILYFGLKYGLKCNKTNINKVYSFIST